MREQQFVAAVIQIAFVERGGHQRVHADGRFFPLLLISATVKVVDAVLKVETSAGPTWHRYSHDGYGQGHDCGPFTSYGVGRVWPLLTGERGHYELAAGHSTEKYLRAMEALASKTGLLPEQSWDEADRPEKFMWLGKPTGSAMPLM